MLTPYALLLMLSNTHIDVAYAIIYFSLLMLRREWRRDVDARMPYTSAMLPLRCWHYATLPPFKGADTR